MGRRQGWMAVLVIVLAVFIFSPWLIGVAVQQKYEKLLNQFSSEANVQLTVTDYQRGWFSSDATLNVDIADPQILQALSFNGNAVPSHLSFTLQQHIQHGPLFFHWKHFRFPSGLVTVHNQLQFSPEFMQFLQNQNMSVPVLESDDDVVTFFGNFQEYFSISNLQITTPAFKGDVQIKNIQGSIFYNPRKPHIKGQVEITNFSFVDPADHVSVPNVSVSFDQLRSPTGIWIGKNDWSFSSASWVSDVSPYVSLSNIKFNGDISEKNGEIFGDRSIDVAKIQIDNEIMGPLQIKLSAQKLNAKAIVDVFSTYQQITKQGEAFQFQLRDKMSSMLPAVINPGASIQLDNVDLKTEFGSLNVKGKLFWPAQNFVAAGNVPELWDYTNMQASLLISKKLTEQIIHIASGMPSFQELSPEEMLSMNKIQYDSMLAIQLNALLIAGLREANQLSTENANLLYVLQKNDPTGERYLSEIKHLFLTKEISPSIAYFLYWEYLSVQEPLQMLQQKIARHQADVEEQLLIQLGQWMKRGYVVLSGQNYVVKMTKENELYRVNGKNF